MDLYLIVASLMLAAAGVFYLGRRSAGQPGLLSILSSLDRERQLLLLTIMGFTVSVIYTGCMILLVVVEHIENPVVISLISGSIGMMITATVITTFNFWFGSSNGSQLKDKAAADAEAAPKGA